MGIASSLIPRPPQACIACSKSLARPGYEARYIVSAYQEYKEQQWHTVCTCECSQAVFPYSKRPGNEARGGLGMTLYHICIPGV